MVVDIDEKNLKHGVLGLVIALVEIIKDALKLQAIKRMEGGSLTEEEMERLGEALMELDAAIEEIKKEQGISESVRSVRDGLDDLVDDRQVRDPRRLADRSRSQGTTGTCSPVRPSERLHPWRVRPLADNTACTSTASPMVGTRRSWGRWG